MAELKTKKNNENVKEFLEKIEDIQKKEDAFKILDMIGEITGVKAKMWGASIIGFGEYHYKYASGREGDFLIAGFSPRKNNFSLYIMSGFEEQDSINKTQELLRKLGKHKIGKSCLYINKLSDIDIEVLKEIVKNGWDYMMKKYN